MKNTSAIVLTPQNTRIIILSLLALMPIIGMAVDLVAPSLPAIAHNLHVSKSMSKNVISIYLLGYALGNFITGFLTDALGRQRLLRIGLVTFIIISFLPVVLPTIEVLFLVRLLQGISLGAVAVLVRAIFSDILTSEKLIRMGTILGTMWGIGPVIGPMIGGYLQHYFGWQAGFVFFTVVVLLLSIIIFIVVPETHFNRHPLNFRIMAKNIREVMTHQLFLSLVILMGIAYSLIIIFQTSGPFLIQTQLNYSAIFFGHLALYLGLVFLISTFCCRFFLKKFKTEQILRAMINLFFVIAILILASGYYFSLNIVFIAISSAVMFFFTGFIFPLSMGKGLSLFRHISGTASAVMYLVNILMTSLTSFLISFLNIRSAIPLVWGYFLLILASMFIYWLIIYKQRANLKS